MRWSGQGSNTRPPARSSDTQPTQPIGWRRYAPDSAVQPLSNCGLVAVLTATYHQDPLFLTLCEDIPYWLKILGEKHRPLTNNTCTSFKFFLDALNHRSHRDCLTVADQDFFGNARLSCGRLILNFKKKKENQIFLIQLRFEGSLRPFFHI